MAETLQDILIKQDSFPKMWTLYALTYLHPYPVNRNGSAELDDLMAKCKMVSAFFNGSFGIYTALEAEIFEMTHITPMN